MAVKRFREVRRGYVSGVLGAGQSNTIQITLTGLGGLGFNSVGTGRGVLFIEAMIMAISPQVATAGGCLIRRAVYTCSGAIWEVPNAEMDHTSDVIIPTTANHLYGIRTTPFPVGVPNTSVVAVGKAGSYPLDHLNFSFGAPYAIISYYLHPSIDHDTSVAHWQDTTEGFEDTSVEV
jgi:hypothetical protein